MAVQGQGSQPQANPYYEFLRKRTQQQSTSDAQTEQDALKRRFASLGGLNSGAYIKQSQIASDNALQRRQQAVEQIDLAEAQENLRRKELEEGRAFQASEAEKQRGFMGGESALQRALAERLQREGQTFQEGILGKQQTFARGEREAGQGFQRDILGQQQSFQQGESALQRALAERLQRGQQDFAREERLGGQGFQEAMLGRQQGFARGEREAGQSFQAGEADKARKLQNDQFLKSFALDEKVKLGQLSLAEAEALRDEITTILNAGTSMAEAADSDDIMGWINRAEELYKNFRPNKQANEVLKNLKPVTPSTSGDLQFSGGLGTFRII